MPVQCASGDDFPASRARAQRGCHEQPIGEKLAASRTAHPGAAGRVAGLSQRRRRVDRRYTFSKTDLAFVRERRSDQNRLDVAIHGLLAVPKPRSGTE